MHALFVLAVLIILAVSGFALLGRNHSQARLRRLQALAGQDSTAPVSAKIAVPVAERLLPPGILRNLHQLGIEAGWRQMVLAYAAAGLPAAIAGIFFGAIFGVMVGTASMLVMVAVLNVLAARRVAELGAVLPGFFDRVRQLLSIGNSLPTAFARAVQGSSPALANFWLPAVRRIGNGASFPESVRQSAEEIDLYEMRLFAAAIATNMRFGGSLTQALGNIVSYLRKRAAIERELRSNTAQLRASAWVLGLLPMFVAGLIVAQNRDYARFFVTNPAGKEMLVYCVVSQFFGALIMRAIIRTKF